MFTSLFGVATSQFALCADGDLAHTFAEKLGEFPLWHSFLQTKISRHHARVLEVRGLWGLQPS